MGSEQTEDSLKMANILVHKTGIYSRAGIKGLDSDKADSYPVFQILFIIGNICLVVFKYCET